MGHGQRNRIRNTFLDLIRDHLWDTDKEIELKTHFFKYDASFTHY
jgi:hypothetical protein